MPATLTLWRPTGPAELALVLSNRADGGFSGYVPKMNSPQQEPMPNSKASNHTFTP